MTTRPTSGAGWKLRWIPNLEKLPTYDGSAVYFIVCKPTKVGYIGSAKQLVERLKHHFGHLALNKHGNYKLQAAFNKYGVDNFDCGVVELCPIEKLAEREEYWINRYPPERLFNIQREVQRVYPIIALHDRNEAKRMAAQIDVDLPIIHAPSPDYIRWRLVRKDQSMDAYCYVYDYDSIYNLCGEYHEWQPWNEET